MILAVTIVDYTEVMAAIAGTCAALTGVAGILLAFSLWWKNRARGALKTWIHETSGAAAVARAVDAAGVALQGVVDAAIIEKALRDQQHTENLEARRQQNAELGALVSSQDKLAVAVKTISDELTLESEERVKQAQYITQIAQDAATGARHARSRKAHPKVSPAT